MSDLRSNRLEKGRVKISHRQGSGVSEGVVVRAKRDQVVQRVPATFRLRLDVMNVRREFEAADATSTTIPLPRASSQIGMRRASAGFAKSGDFVRPSSRAAGIRAVVRSRLGVPVAPFGCRAAPIAGDYVIPRIARMELTNHQPSVAIAARMAAKLSSTRLAWHHGECLSAMNAGELSARLSLQPNLRVVPGNESPLWRDLFSTPTFAGLRHGGNP